MKRRKHSLDIFEISLLLALLMFISCYSASGLYAKYTSVASGSSTATVASWDAVVTAITIVNDDAVAGLEHYEESEYSDYGIDDVDMDSNGYVMSGYRFTLVTGTATQVRGSLSVEISISQEGTERWPDGVEAALYGVTDTAGVESYTFIGENSTGVFEDIETVAPETEFSGEYIVCFKASPTTVVGTYDITVSAAMNQVD